MTWNDVAMTLNKIILISIHGMFKANCFNQFTPFFIPFPKQRKNLDVRIFRLRSQYKGTR